MPGNVRRVSFDGFESTFIECLFNKKGGLRLVLTPKTTLGDQIWLSSSLLQALFSRAGMIIH